MFRLALGRDMMGGREAKLGYVCTRPLDKGGLGIIPPILSMDFGSGVLCCLCMDW